MMPVVHSPVTGELRNSIVTRYIEPLPRHHLYIYQVEVLGVRVAGGVEDARRLKWLMEILCSRYR